MSRFLLVLLTVVAVNVTAVELLETTRSWDGGLFRYPDGNPEITAIILDLKAGEETAWHCHPVPTQGYVIQGTLEVETFAGNNITLNEGQAVVEVMQTLHRGRGSESGAQVVVFYAGAENLPNTVLKDDPAADTLCLQ